MNEGNGPRSRKSTQMPSSAKANCTILTLLMPSQWWPSSFQLDTVPRAQLRGVYQVCSGLTEVYEASAADDASNTSHYHYRICSVTSEHRTPTDKEAPRGACTGK